MATNVVVIGLSAIFDRGKTTIPSGVRKRLQVKDGDQLVWMFQVDSKEVFVKANVAVQEPKGRYV